MTAIVIVKTGILSEANRRQMKRAGLIVVESDSENGIQMITPITPIMPVDKTLHAALAAIVESQSPGTAMGFLKKLVANMGEQLMAVPE